MNEMIGFKDTVEKGINMFGNCQLAKYLDNKFDENQDKNYDSSIAKEIAKNFPLIAIPGAYPPIYRQSFIPIATDGITMEMELIKNKYDGLRREHEVEKELKETYPPEKGYSIISEAYLRDKDGNIVKDPDTGEARRIDFVVVKNGKVVDSIEVTSKTADKSDQTAKEERIRESGGNYIRDYDGNLAKIPLKVQTRIERRD